MKFKTLRKVKSTIRQNRQKMFPFFVGALVVLVPILYLTIIRPRQAQAVWYNESFLYRQKFTFTHNANITSQRAVTFSLDTAELITGGVMEGDCADTRFTDINGEVLPYELTGTCNNAATTYEVVFSSINNGTNVGYVYYGQPQATDQSIDSSVYTALTPSGGDPAITTRTNEERSPGPVAYWRMDEGRTDSCPSADVCDSAGQLNHGQLTGATWSSGAECVNGKCLKFDGIDDFVTRSYDSDFNFGTESFTVSGWFKSKAAAAPTYSANTIINFGGWEHGEEAPSDTDGGTDAYQWDFDHAGTSNVSSTQNTVKRSGDFGLDYDGLAPSFDNEWIVIRKPNRSTIDEEVVWFTFYYYPTDQTDTVLPGLVEFNGDCSNELELNGDSWDLQLTAATDSAHIAVTPNEWNKIEVMIDCPNSNSTLSVNDSATVSNTTFGGGFGGDVVTEIYHGVTNSGMYSGQAYYDDWVVSTAELEFDPAVYALNVDGDGNSTDWDATNGYQEIDDIPEDGDTTYITSSTATDKQLVSLESVSSAGIAGSVQAVKTQALVRDEGGASNLATVVRTGGTDYDQGEDVDPGASYNSIGTVLQTNPNTSSNWTTEDLDALEIGVLNNASVASRVTNTMAMVLTDSAPLDQYILSRYDNDQGYKIWLDENDYLNFAIDDDATWDPDDIATTTTGYADNKWHHFSAVKNGTTDITLYIDGKQEAQDSSISATGTLTSDSAALSIGTDEPTNQNFYEGFLDELKIFPYARSSAQIKADASKEAVSRGATASFGQSNNSNLTEGLVAYWKLDESATGTRYDATLNDYDLTDTNTTEASAGKFGYAADFEDDNDEYLSVADNADLSAGDRDFTISAWVKMETGTHDMTALSKHDSSGDQREYSLRLNNFGCGGNPCFEFEYSTDGTFGTTSQVYASSVSSPSTETWYFITLWHDAKNDEVGIQVNDTAPSTKTLSGGIYDSTADFMVGTQRETIGNWDGEVDEVRFYNRVLSPAERRQLYNWAPEPVAYFPFDENTGTTTVYDISGNTLSGSMAGSMTESDWISGKYGAALEFDGANDYINAGSDALVDDLFDTGGTVAAWIYPHSDGGGDGGHIISKRNLGGWFLAVDSEAAGAVDLTFLHFFNSQANNGQWRASTQTLPLNTWSHVAVTYDNNSTATTPTLYINGKSVSISADSTPTGTRDSDAADTLAIANRGATGREFDGGIDDVRLYNYIRTPSQIIQDMNGGHPLGGSPIGSQISYWSFDETSGETINDSVGSNNGNLAGGDTCPGDTQCPTWITSSKVNGGLSFDNGDLIEIADDDSLSFGNGTTDSPFSITAWINYNDATGGEIFTKAPIGSTSEYRFTITSSDNLSINLNGGGGDLEQVSVPTVPQDEWHHVAVTYDGSGTVGGLTLYIDGREVAYTDGSGGTYTAMTNQATNVTIGGRYNGTSTANGLDGDLDEIKLYGAELTADEILIDMNSNAAADFGSTTDEKNNLEGGAGTPPVLQLNLDEKSGSTTYDKSGNGFDGTISNGHWKSTNSCKEGACLGLVDDDIQDVITVTDPSTEELDFTGSEDYSTSFWVKWNSIEGDGFSYVFSKNVDGNPSNYGYATRLTWGGGAGSVACSFNTSLGEDTAEDLGAGINDDEWHHVACIMDRNGSEFGSTGLHLVVDGVVLASDTSLLGGDSSNSANLLIGETDVTDLNASVDKIKIWDRALTMQELQYEYNRGAPVFHWQFDECSGTTTYDASGNGNNGTINHGGSGGNTSAGSCDSSAGNEMWDNGTTGKINASLDFDGSNDYVVSDSVATSLNNNFSFSAWVKWAGDTGSDQYVVFNGTGSCNGWGLRTTESDSDELAILSDCAGTATSNELLPTSEWTHLVVIRDSGVFKIFVNGSEITLGTPSGYGLTAPSTRTVIGASNTTPSSAFNGQIDDVRFYNYVLSESQIKTIINKGGAADFSPSTGSP